MQNPIPPRQKVIRLPACLEIIGLSRSTLYDLTNPDSVRHDPSFPKKLRIGSRAIGWWEHEVLLWAMSKQES